MLKIHNRICLIALAFLAVLCFSITVNASGGPSSGSSGTATVGAITLSYKWDSTYYPFAGYSSVRQNGAASVNWNDTDDTFSLSATSATYKNYYVYKQYAQDVSAECTITNNTGNVLEISYSKDASVRVAVSNGTLNSEKIVLENTGTITLLVITETKYNNTSPVDVSGTFKITSCNAVTSYNVNLQPSPFGNYSYAIGTASGSIAAGGSKYVTTANSGVEVSCAVPTILDSYKGDYYFYGWSVNGVVTATTSAYSGTISTHTTVLPVFLKNGEETDGGPFLVNGKRYIFWSNALKAAGNQYPVVIARDDYKLPATIQEQGAAEADGVYFVEANGSISYNIPSGVVVLVPFDDANTLITDMSSEVSETYETPVEYRKLILESGAKITVASGGVLCVGSRAYRQASGQTGAHGSIELEEDSEIIVDGKLYAWGYIFGDGIITANTGSSVYQMLSAPDYPNSASTAVDLKKAKVFPMRVYSWQNVEVPLTVKYGSTLYGFYHVYGSNAGNHPGTVKIFGTGTDAIFQMTKSGSEATASFSEGKQKIILKGEFALNSLSVTVTVYMLITYTETISTSDAQGLPLPGHFDITLKSGAKVVSNENIIVTKGAKITIEENATFDANSKNLYVLDASDDPGPPASAGLAGYTVYLKDRYGNDYSQITEDATIVVNGTLKASGGFYTSAGGANIISTGNGKIEVTGTSTETSVVLKANQGASTSITISPAQLKNENGTTITSGTATYYHAHYDCTACNNNGQCGVWHNATHQESKNVVDPTCTENGYTKYTCVCSHSYTTDIKAFLGHKPGAAATCTTAQTCTVCNIDIVGAKGHAWEWGEWSPAEKGQQCTCTCRNDASHTITVLLAYRMDSYIWLNATVSSTVGTLVCNEMTLQSTSGGNYLVQKVLSNHITDSVCVSFQVDEFGKTNKLEIGFLEYAKLLSANTNTTDETVKLLASMLMYGEASEDYFGNGEDATGNDNGTILTAYQTSLLNNTAIPERLKTALRACALSGHSADKVLLKPADTNANYGEKGLENGLTISTTGAAFYFDEALRLSVGYRFADGVTVNLDENGNPDGTITFGDTTYTVLQIGLLVQELEDWTMCDVLYAEDGVTAYIAYDNSAEIDPTGPENHPEVGEGGPDPFVNTLGSSGEINFDLLVKEYNKGFALRTYAVLKDANGTQYVIYGKQYGYGLEAYVNAMYDTEASGDQFNYLLATAWEYAKAAATKYPEVNQNEETV